MKKKTTWNGEYKDIPFEIQNFSLGDINGWTFYIYLREKQLDSDFFESIWLDGKPMEFAPRHISYDYYNSPIGNLDFHGGCTWYSKEGGYDGAQRVVRTGCDYQHYFDEVHRYNEIIVEDDVRQCIDSLYELTTPKRWCTYCGDYFCPSGEEERCAKCIDK